jgi:hypothetical protein
MPLGGDGGEEHDARRSLPAVVSTLCLLDELLEVFLERRDTGRPFERFVVTEECEDDVRLLMLQPIVGRAEALGPLAHRQLVAREAQIAEDEIVTGKRGINQRLEPARMLHAVGQRIADNADVVPFLEFE